MYILRVTKKHQDYKGREVPLKSDQGYHYYTTLTRVHSPVSFINRKAFLNASSSPVHIQTKYSVLYYTILY